MKALFYICAVPYFITILLYLSVILGLYAQLFLGFIHVIVMLLLYLQYNELAEQSRRKLNYYSITVLVYFGLMPVFASLFPELSMLLGFYYLTIVPMSIGGYFVYILYHFMRFENNEINSQKMHLADSIPSEKK